MIMTSTDRTDQLSLNVVSTLNWGRSILGFTCIVLLLVVVVGTVSVVHANLLI